MENLAVPPLPFRATVLQFAEFSTFQTYNFEFEFECRDYIDFDPVITAPISFGRAGEKLDRDNVTIIAVVF